MLWYPTTTSAGFCFQYLDSRKTSLPSLTCLWKIEVTWCWLELLFMLTVQGFRKFKFLAKNSLNFIYFTTITKQLILIMLVTMFAFRWSSCGRKPEYPEETHLSLVTNDHFTCRCQVLNLCLRGERLARYHYASQTAKD